MGKWKTLRNWIVDEDGTEIAVIQSNLFKPSDIVEQIVREHNAHEGLADLVKEYQRQTIDTMPKKTQGGDFTKRTRKRKRDRLARIDAVLAQAEGRE